MRTGDYSHHAARVTAKGTGSHRTTGTAGVARLLPLQAETMAVVPRRVIQSAREHGYAVGPVWHAAPGRTL